jgi:RNA polymerase sigma-70 factor (ECF subfamily)
MPDDISTDLILRAQNGEPAGIGAIYERFHLSVYRYLYYRIGERQAAEDLTADVFLRMLRSISTYQTSKVTFQAWLYQIARNLAIDHYRRMKFRNHVELEETIVSREADVEATVDRSMTHTHLRDALDRLPEDQRDVIVLRFVANLPIAQVAQTLHKSENSIKGLQRRGLVGLRDLLVEWESSYA